MTDREFKEQLLLYVQDELSPEARAHVEQHLQSSPDARMELKELQKFFGALEPYKISEPSGAMLETSRRHLSERLRQATAPLSVWQQIQSSFFPAAAEPSWTPRYQVALAGFALFIGGLMAGYAVVELGTRLPEVQPIASDSKSSDAQITNVQIMATDTASGQIEFQFDTVTPTRVRGRVDDDRVKRMLANALLNGANAGLRLQALNMIRLNRPKLVSPFITAALIKAMTSDENDGVRKEAILLLSLFPPDSTITQGFLTVLTNDKNDGLRIDAVNALTAKPVAIAAIDPAVQRVLAERSRAGDENKYIRIRAIQYLNGEPLEPINPVDPGSTDDATENN
ncbi:MAG: HEAT repeat domain-containing protein [Rhizobacter sp.]|nr:HEAT repeat domain-containing protein [Chlorobiales bacterium]